MNNKYYDSYFSVIKNRDCKKEIVNKKYEDNENDHISFIDFITPNHHIRNKPRETILK